MADLLTRIEAAGAGALADGETYLGAQPLTVKGPVALAALFAELDLAEALVHRIARHGAVEELEVADGERVLVSSPRGRIEMSVRIQPNLPAGLTFTTYHFSDLADINTLTNDAYDERSGTSEFKAAAIRIDKLVAEHQDPRG